MIAPTTTVAAESVTPARSTVLTWRAMLASARVLAAVPNYDDVVFSTFDRFIEDSSHILDSLQTDRRSARAYFEHLVKTRQEEAAAALWPQLLRLGCADDHVASVYLAGLAAAGEGNRAVEVRRAYLNGRPGAHTMNSLVFNGGFESEIARASFDWQVWSIENVEIVRDNSVSRTGNWSMRVRFPGDRNLQFQGLFQEIPLPPGVYRLRAFVKTDGLTTDEGVRLRAFDPRAPGELDASGDALSGTNGWSELSLKFRITPRLRFVRVGLWRARSSKFECNISGTAWLDDVSIEPALMGAGPNNL